MEMCHNQDLNFHIGYLHIIYYTFTAKTVVTGQEAHKSSMGASPYNHRQSP